MKTCSEMYSNVLMPGVTVKSRTNFNGMDPSNAMDQSLSKPYMNARNVLPLQPTLPPPTNKDTMNTSQSYKGFYTWLSSPKTIYNHRKMSNVAVIAPTQHHT